MGRKSHPRFRREGEAPRVELTEDDAEILRHVYRHRFVSSEDLFRLFADRSPDKLSRRLTRLYRTGYLDRPRAQIDHYRQGGSRAIVYGLDEAGARTLKERFGILVGGGDWRTRNRNYTRESMDHTLAVTRFLIDIELACRRQSDLSHIPFEEILKQAPEDTRMSPTPARWKVPVAWQGSRASVTIIPDAIFGIGVGRVDGSRRDSFVFLEIDRGTMTIAPAERTREGDSFLYRTSVLRKFVCYAESYRQGLHKDHLGIPSARMLTLTTSEARAEAMRKAALEFVVRPLKVPPGLFLFGVQTSPTNALKAGLQTAAGDSTGLISNSQH
jgi:hypothetical protein